MDFGELVRTQGLPVTILLIAVVTLWVTWRADTKEASAQRERNIEALSELKTAVESNQKSTDALTNGLSKFFLKNFPE